MAEHKKYKKTGIVIIIGAILLLIMRLYILSAILFLIGLIAATYPFIKNNTNDTSGLDIEDSKCNCESCDSKGCNDCNNLNCDNIDSEVISSTDDSQNITSILNENDDVENKEIEPEILQNADAKSEIESDIKDNEDEIEFDSDTKSEVDIEPDMSMEPEIDEHNPVIQVDFENGTKATTDANSLDDEDNSEVDAIIDDNEKDDK